MRIFFDAPVKYQTNYFTPQKQRNNQISTVSDNEQIKTCDIPHYRPMNISFQGVDEFAKQFDSEFFFKLFNYVKKATKKRLPCGYTGVDLVLKKEYSKLLNSGKFSGRSVDAIREFAPYENCLYPEQKKIYNELKRLSEKYPNLNMHELVKSQYKHYKRIVLANQHRYFNQLTNNALRMSGIEKKEDLDKISKILKKCKNDLDKKHCKPQEEFMRTRLLNTISNTEFSSPEINKLCIKIITDIIPEERCMENFFVKYAHSHKVKYKDGKFSRKEAITPANTLLGLLKPSFATYEHVYARSRARTTDRANFQVLLLTSSEINSRKAHHLLDDFILSVKDEFDIAQNLQKQIDILIETYKKIKNKDDPFVEKLKSYIQVLKQEFDRDSDIIKLDISKLLYN